MYMYEGGKGVDGDSWDSCLKERELISRRGESEGRGGGREGWEVESLKMGMETAGKELILGRRERKTGEANKERDRGGRGREKKKKKRQRRKQRRGEIEGKKGRER